jgi:hypothetical protein
MMVMNDVAQRRPEDEEPEPSLGELLEWFEAGEPVDLVRSPRRLPVEYRYSDGMWHATSPAIASYAREARTLFEARRAVHDDLAAYVPPETPIDEHVVEAPVTEGTGITVVTTAPEVVTDPRTTTSRSRAAVSAVALVTA